MLTMIVSMKAKSGSEAEFERILGELLREVEGEPGSGGVVWGRRVDGEGYTLVERYKDQQALEAHRVAPHMATLGVQLQPHIDGAPAFHLIEEL